MIISTKTMNAIITDPAPLNPTDRIVFQRLLWVRNSESGQCNPPEEILARDLHLGIATIKRSVRRLEEAGWLTRQRIGKKQTNEYDIHRFVRDQIDTSLNGVTDQFELSQLQVRDQIDPREGSKRSVVRDQIDTSIGKNKEKEENERTLSDFAQLNINKLSPESSNGHHTHGALRGFEDWYAIYPKKQARGDAERAWIALHPNPALIEKMIAAVYVQMRSEQWTKDGGKYIPLPATWIRGKRWEDELVIRPNGRVSEMPKGFQ
jgi:hypothetical protein